ncbi:MAG: hypothetical protein IJ892_08170 [Prevotella sp.]|nr:hypothetical protein [Prevotella sp.]
MALRRIGRLLGLSLVFCHLSFSSALAQSSSAWRDSLAVLNKAITANPQSTDLRLRKAAVNIELQQWDYAIEEYGRVLGIDANNLPALYYRAFAHNHLRHYDMARADYERFLQLLPRHFEARLGLAMTMRRQGKTRDVTDELNRLVQMFPDSAVAYAVRADFEQEQAQYDLALYDWDEALRLANGRQEYQLGKYGVLWAMRRYDEARRLGEQLLEAGVPNATLKQLQVDGRKKK